MPLIREYDPDVYQRFDLSDPINFGTHCPYLYEYRDETGQTRRVALPSKVEDDSDAGLLRLRDQERREAKEADALAEIEIYVTPAEFGLIHVALMATPHTDLAHELKRRFIAGRDEL